MPAINFCQSLARGSGCCKRLAREEAAGVRQEERGAPEDARGVGNRACQIMLATSCNFICLKKRGTTMWSMMWRGGQHLSVPAT